MTKLIDNQKVLKRATRKKRQNKVLRDIRTYVASIFGKIKFPSLKIKEVKLSGKFMIITGSSVGAVLVFSLLLIYLPVNDTFKGTELFLPEDEYVYHNLVDLLDPFILSMGSGEYPFDEDFVIPVNSPSVYQIQDGDTLSEIAAKYDISVSTLVSYNNINNVRRLLPGTPLRIPSIDGVSYKVKNGESLEMIATKYSTKVTLILDANNLETDVIHPGDELFIPGARMNPYDLAKAKGELFIYPTRGRFTSGFGYRSDPFTGVKRFHYGIDLANAIGTRVNASMAGRVVLVENGSTGYGRYVVIKHAYGGYQTLYGHLNTILVRTNQWVEQGQIIGRMGNTGRSTGPHLHFSVYQNNKPVNPMSLLK